jgi:hypothetical protein
VYYETIVFTERLKIMENKTMKSRVMSLGNKLAAKESELGRSEAFVRAWAIVKAGSLTLPVRGVTFGNRQTALRRLTAYRPEEVWAFIVPEPSNRYDRKALAVMVGVQNGRGLYRLGYVPRERARAAASLGKIPALRITDGGIMGAKVTLGV